MFQICMIKSEKVFSQVQKKYQRDFSLVTMKYLKTFFYYCSLIKDNIHIFLEILLLTFLILIEILDQGVQRAGQATLTRWTKWPSRQVAGSQRIPLNNVLHAIKLWTAVGREKHRQFLTTYILHVSMVIVVEFHSVVLR